MTKTHQLKREVNQYQLTNTYLHESSKTALAPKRYVSVQLYLLVFESTCIHII